MSTLFKKCSRCGTTNPIGASFCRHCGKGFSEESKKGQILEPIIKDFIVVDNNYTIGSIVNLLWDVYNADELILNGESVINHDSYEYMVTGDSIIELVAKNEYKQTIKKLKISPLPLPKIVKFDINRDKIIEGETAKLIWEVKNAARIILHSSISGDIDLSKRIKYEFKPLVNEILTLECFSKDPKISIKQDIHVNVLKKVKINCFKAANYSILESQKVKLTWNIENATSVTLYPGALDVTDLNEIVLAPAQTSNYILVAKNGISSKTATISINVKPLPRLDYSVPDVFSSIKLPTLHFDLSSFTDNLVEIDIDKWISRPLDKHNKTHTIVLPIKKILRKFIEKINVKRYYPTFEVESFMYGLRFLLLIIVLLIGLSNVSMFFYASNLLWIKIVSILSFCSCLLYGGSLILLFNKRLNYYDDPILKVASFILLLLSTVSIELYSVSGGDYSLFSKLGIHIWGRERIWIPILLLLFIILTHLLSIRFLSIIRQKEKIYYEIKKDITI